MGKKSDAAERMAVACESMAAVFVEMSNRDRYVEELREQLGAAEARISDLEWVIEGLRKSSEPEEPEESGLLPPGDKLLIVP
jgi:prefoldin subunit 5